VSHLSKRVLFKKEVSELKFNRWNLLNMTAIYLYVPVSKRINFRKINTATKGRKAKTLINSEPIKFNFRGKQMEHTANGETHKISLNDLLSRVRSFFASWHGSSVKHSRIRAVRESREFKRFEIETIAKLAKAEGIDIVRSRADDLEELFQKIAAIKVILADSRFELARKSFSELIDLCK